MKRRIIAVLAIMTIAASITGCGCTKKNDGGSNIVDNVKTTLAPGETNAPKSAEQVQEELDNFAKDADENADTSKIEGKELKGDKVKADLDGYEVEIGNAVLADGATSKVIVVEFKFTNKTSTPTKFASVVTADAFQEGTPLAPAATFNAEGYEILTTAQDVKYNETITVQKAYVVTDESLPVTINVSKHASMGSSQIYAKTFDIQ